MSLLTGPEIERQRTEGNIIIDPFDPSLVGPNSVDLHLGEELYVYGHPDTRNIGADEDARSLNGEKVRLSSGHHLILDPYNDSRHIVLDSKDLPKLARVPRTPQGGFVLHPKRLYLGHTLEYTETFGFVPRVDGRSSLGRMGVFAHITAGQGDNGFCGRWTLEIHVVEPIILYPGERYFQILYETVEGEETYYGQTGNTSGRYQGDMGVVASRIQEDE